MCRALQEAHWSGRAHTHTEPKSDVLLYHFPPPLTQGLSEPGLSWWPQALLTPPTRSAGITGMLVTTSATCVDSGGLSSVFSVHAASAVIHQVISPVQEFLCAHLTVSNYQFFLVYEGSLHLL